MSETRGLEGPIAWGSTSVMDCLCAFCRLHRVLPTSKVQTFIEYHNTCHRRSS